MLRFAIKGNNDTGLAFAEEKTNDSRRILVVLGGWHNTTTTVNWIHEKSDANPFKGPQDKYSHQE